MSSRARGHHGPPLQLAVLVTAVEAADTTSRAIIAVDLVLTHLEHSRINTELLRRNHGLESLLTRCM
jgi:hypothetical protein